VPTAGPEPTSPEGLLPGIPLDGLLHSITMGKTIRGGTVRPLLEVTREEFFSAMDVSGYSLLAVTRALLNEDVLRRSASIVALSYLRAERVARHPYKNSGPRLGRRLSPSPLRACHRRDPARGRRVRREGVTGRMSFGC